MFILQEGQRLGWGGGGYKQTFSVRKNVGAGKKFGPINQVRIKLVFFLFSLVKRVHQQSKGDVIAVSLTLSVQR